MKFTKFCPILSAGSAPSPAAGPGRLPGLAPLTWAVTAERKPLRHGAPGGAGDGRCSEELPVPGELLSRRSWGSAVLGLPARSPMSVFSGAREPALDGASAFLFLFLRKFPLSNIFSQLGSRVQ